MLQLLKLYLGPSSTCFNSDTLGKLQACMQVHLPRSRAHTHAWGQCRDSGACGKPGAHTCHEQMAYTDRAPMTQTGCLHPPQTGGPCAQRTAHSLGEQHAHVCGGQHVTWQTEGPCSHVDRVPTHPTDSCPPGKQRTHVCGR